MGKKNKNRNRGGKKKNKKNKNKGGGGGNSFSLPNAPGISSPFFDPNQKFNLGTAAGAAEAQLAGQGYNAALMDYYNRMNEQNAFGSRTYSTDESGRTTVTDQLDPALQSLLQSIQGQAQATAGQFGSIAQPLDFSSLGALPSQEDFADERKRIEQDLYNQFNEQNQPLFDEQRSQLETSLTQRGIPIGSELYKQQLSDLQEQQDAAREGYRQQAYQQAGAEADRMFQNSLTSRQAQAQEMLQQRSNPLQELGSLLSLQQGLPQLNFGPATPIQLPGLDLANIGLGYGELAATLRGQDIGAQTARGSAPQYRDYLAEIAAQGAQDRANLAFQYGLQPPAQQAPSSDPYGGIIGGIGAGLGAGLGSAFGNWFGG